MINLFLTLIMTLISSISTCQQDEFPEFGKEGEVTLELLDLPKDEALYNIAKRCINEEQELQYKVSFYRIYMTDHKGVTKVSVSADSYENIYGDCEYDGYYLLDGNLIVIENKGSYKLPPTVPSKSKTFKTFIPYPCPYDPKEWLYCIASGLFGLHVDYVGWVWYEPDDMTISSKDNTIIVTMPKRVSK